MKYVDIRGKERFFLERVLNRQQSRDKKDHFKISDVKSLKNNYRYPEDFLNNLETSGLLEYIDDHAYVTELGKASLNFKEKQERSIINKYILDDFEFAFLHFMNFRNEPVAMFHFPLEFEYHSKIHMKPVEGKANVYMDWLDEVYKYIHDPTIDGYILNEVGRNRYEKLLKEKERKEEKENLEMQKLRTEVVNLTNIVVDYPNTRRKANWGFYISIGLFILAALTLIIKLKSGK